MRDKFFISCKLRLVALVSSLALAIFTLLSNAVVAHEVQPAIADIEVTDGQVVLSLELNLEAYLSGIDLDGLTDTDDAEDSDVYDQLRNLSPEDMAGRVPELVQAWNAVPIVTQSGTSSVMTLSDVTIPEIGDVEITRLSKLTLVAPANGPNVQVTWPKGAGDMVVRQQGVDAPFTGYLSGGETSPEIAITGGGAKSGMGVFVEYIPVGFDHILPKGLDHILFVLGLFFLSMGLRALLWQITAFTAAHTVTLALGALGWVTVPGSIVEPLIAASIVYVAVENIFASKLNPWRPVIVFGFGLLHGLGFASVLGEFGLPEAQFIPALLGFNVGVEVGQLTVIAIAFVLVGWAASKPWYRKAVAIPASCMIALIGAYWVIERTLL